MAHEVERFKALGGQALVEVTTCDFGRDIRQIAAVAELAQIPIVATVGFVRGNWIEKQCPWVSPMSEQELAKLFVHEIREGVENTAWKVGAIKVPGSYQRITPLEEKVIRAGASAHRETGVPVICHSGFGTVGLKQLAILEAAGVEASHCIVSHVDHACSAGTQFDFYELLEIVEKGSFVCFNQIGRTKYGPDSARIDTIVALAGEGFLDQLLVSGLYARKSEMAVLGGGPGLAYALETFAPRLKRASQRAGLDASVVYHKVFVDNPARAFTFA